MVTLLATAPAAPAEAQGREYDRTIREAVREFQAGHWNEARVLFREAHGLYPNARTLRGMGMAYFEVRDYADAYRHLRLALEDPEQPLTRRQREETERLMERAGQFLGHMRFVVTPDDATVTMDMGELRLEEDGTVLVDLQSHTLQVAAEGYITQTQRFEVDGGESRTVHIDLQPVPAVVVAPPPDPGFPVVPVVFGAAGLMAGAAVVGVVWFVNRSDEVSRCDAAQADPTLECNNGGTLASQRDGALAFTIVAATLAVAAATTGLILMLTGDRDDEDDENDPDADDAHTHDAPTVSVGCAPALLGATCVGSF